MKKTTKYSMLALMSLMSLIILMSLASALVINSVTMNPTNIAPGDTSSITISLKNNGDNDLTDVSISLDFTNIPLAPYGSGSDYNINELNSGKIKDASFDIIAFNDAAPGIYKIPVKISYTEDSVVKTQQSVIGVTINSEPIIDVVNQDGLLLKGQNNKITLEVINKGLANVKFLEIDVGSSTFYNTISQDNVYIGDVDANDFQTADFNIFINNNAPRSVNLPVTVLYKDITNKQYTKTFDISLKTYTTQEAQSLGLVPVSNTIYIVILIIVLIVVFIIYRIIRSRRRKRNENL